MRKGIILSAVGILLTLLGVCAVQHAYTPAKEEDEEAQFLGEAASSIGTITGAIMFLIIFAVLAGIALVIYGANKAAKNSQNISFDEKARRVDRGLDLALKTKRVIKA